MDLKDTDFEKQKSIDMKNYANYVLKNGSIMKNMKLVMLEGRFSDGDRGITLTYNG